MTRENSPTHTAFITPDALQRNIEKRLILFALHEGGKMAGCVGIAKATNGDCYYIEKLCARVFNEEGGEKIAVKPEMGNTKSVNTLLSSGFTYDPGTEVYIKRK